MMASRLPVVEVPIIFCLDNVSRQPGRTKEKQLNEKILLFMYKTSQR